MRVLLERSLDYAGLFPPAALPLEEVCANYERYRASSHAWMLNRLVLPQSRLAEVAINPEWRVSVIAEEPFPLEQWVAAVETKSMAEFGVRTYREIAVDQVPEIDCWKFRTGSGDMVSGIAQCSRRILPFKLTAGLHHALRGESHQGFLNVFIGSAFAWHNRKLDFWHAIFEERDAEAFRFGDELGWRDHVLTLDQVRAARRDFVHAFGSCSFEEPIADLEQLGLL